MSRVPHHKHTHTRLNVVKLNQTCVLTRNPTSVLSPCQLCVVFVCYLSVPFNSSIATNLCAMCICANGHVFAHVAFINRGFVAILTCTHKHTHTIIIIMHTFSHPNDIESIYLTVVNVALMWLCLFWLFEVYLHIFAVRYMLFLQRQVGQVYDVCFARTHTHTHIT